jgi:hypothetical protein
LLSFDRVLATHRLTFAADGPVGELAGNRFPA